jgi:hypothetical protein
MRSRSLVDGTGVSKKYTASIFDEEVLRSIFLGNIRSHMPEYNVS